MRLERTLPSAAALLVGPSLDRRRNFAGRAVRFPHFKGRASSLARRKPFVINLET
jgi:hypothetical protein